MKKEEVFVREDGDANVYTIIKKDNSPDGRWVASVRLNGEIGVTEQRGLISLMASAEALKEELNDCITALRAYKKMYEALQPAGGWQGVYELGNMAIKNAQK